MAPEYVLHGHLSVKVDVYSFGILLLELMSGRKNIKFNLSLEMQILLEWVRFVSIIFSNHNAILVIWLIYRSFIGVTWE